MIFERIKTPGIGHMAYLLAEEGVAALVDPGRDVKRYLDLIEANGLRLRWVLETHRQEDFEMGGASLRQLTGAEIVACDHEIMRHADRPLTDGEEIELAGGVSLRGLHTPGHTPESMCFAVTLDAASDRPWGVFTGDAMFIGDTGRTDLPDADRTGENAGLLYDMVRSTVLPLGDQAFVLPAHGSGSACGGNVADRDHSTIGIEEKTNTVAVMSRDDFIRHKLQEKLSRPPYFRLMEEVNLQAGRPLEDTPLAWLPTKEFAARSRDGLVIDTRAVEAYAGAHIEGSYSVWLDGMARYGGWVTDDATPVFIVADGPAAAAAARLSLARIGRDTVAGALAGGFDAWRNAGLPFERAGTVTAREAADRLDDVAFLDVREAGEFEAGHIPGARHAFVGHLEDRLSRLGLSRDEPIMVTCSVGHRASLAVSILKRNGYADVRNLLGGMTAWEKLDLPVEEGEAEVPLAAQ